MTTKEQLQEIIAKVSVAETALGSLDISTQPVDVDDELSPQFEAIYDSVGIIRAWANQKILEADQEQVMNGFLMELKVVFDKYSAILEVGTSADGYGENWGGAGSVGIKLTAMLDNVLATKEINKAVITGDDLI